MHIWKSLITILAMLVGFGLVFAPTYTVSAAAKKVEKKCDATGKECKKGKDCKPANCKAEEPKAEEPAEEPEE
jgi:hypothetical protein